MNVFSLHCNAHKPPRHNIQNLHPNQYFSLRFEILVVRESVVRAPTFEFILVVNPIFENMLKRITNVCCVFVIAN